MLIRRFREADAEKVSAMIAPKLKQGDEIRVIAPSRSLAAVWVEKYEKALAYLESQGFKVSFSSNIPIDGNIYFCGVFLKLVTTVTSLEK